MSAAAMWTAGSRPATTDRDGNARGDPVAKSLGRRQGPGHDRDPLDRPDRQDRADLVEGLRPGSDHGEVARVLGGQEIGRYSDDRAGAQSRHRVGVEHQVSAHRRAT